MAALPVAAGQTNLERNVFAPKYPTLELRYIASNSRILFIGPNGSGVTSVLMQVFDTLQPRQTDEARARNFVVCDKEHRDMYASRVLPSRLIYDCADEKLVLIDKIQKNELSKELEASRHSALDECCGSHMIGVFQGVTNGDFFWIMKYLGFARQYSRTILMTCGSVMDVAPSVGDLIDWVVLSPARRNPREIERLQFMFPTDTDLAAALEEARHRRVFTAIYNSRDLLDPFAKRISFFPFVHLNSPDVYFRPQELKSFEQKRVVVENTHKLDVAESSHASSAISEKNTQPSEKRVHAQDNVGQIVERPPIDDFDGATGERATPNEPESKIGTLFIKIRLSLNSTQTK